MNKRTVLWAPLLVLTTLGSWAVAHSEHEKARFVAPNGSDIGSCSSLASPCASIAYAARHAVKGDRILVAGGAYSVQSADDLFVIASGLLNVEVGYDRYDLYQRQDLDRNPVTLTGVPAAYRTTLESRGFTVVADGKSLGRSELTRSNAMLASVEAMAVAKRNEPCQGGSAGGLPCESLDLLSHTPLATFSTSPSEANDIWGFFDLNTFREYVIIGLRNGYSIMDVTDPTAPVEVASFSATVTVWRDIKVLQRFDPVADRFEAFAYVTADGAPDQLQIVDLRNLPHSAQRLTAGGDFNAAHNVYLANAEFATGLPLPGTEPRLQIAGASVGGGAIRQFDLDDPTNPQLSQVSPGGYAHDAASLRITGARTAQCANATTLCEVVADFNESTIELWDVTNGANPVSLSSTPYANSSYTHSGWPTDDQNFLLVHDELDEQQRGLNTTVRIFSLANLQAPTLVATWSGPTRAVDHNGFARGNRYYMSNYTRGLTVLDITDPTTPTEAAFLDTFAPSDADAFSGAWGVYPFLPSGTLAISDIDSGLYLGKDQSLETPAGMLVINQADVGGDEGSSLSWQVSRVGGNTGEISVSYEFIPASTDETELPATGGTLTWPDGDSGDRTITLTTLDDGQSEGLEMLLVRLLNPTNGSTLGNGALARGFVADQGAPPEIVIDDDATLQLDESDGQTVVTIKRTGSATVAASVDVLLGGTATQGADYTTAAPTTLNWAAGDGSPRSITFSIVDDSDDEPNEALSVTLTNPQGATIAGAASAERTIIDNDTAPTPPPVTPTPPSNGGGGGGHPLGILGLLGLALGLRRIRLRQTGRAG